MPISTIPHPSSSKSKSTSTSTSSKSPSPTRPYYFWKPQTSGGFLSQWYVSPFTDSTGAAYATAEMYMMVQKARLFGDERTAKMMLKTTDPKEHKNLGRLVEGFSEKVWNENKLAIVTEGNYLKFTASEHAEILKNELLETGERELVEASPFDRIWGVGYKKENAEQNRQRWGQNLLGKALMDVRGRLRMEEVEKVEKK